MSRFKQILLKYGITTAVAGGMTVFLLWLRDYSEAVTLADRYRLLADAFTIPGVLLVMVAALVWISSDGFFDGLAYAFSRVGSMFIPFHRQSAKHMTYYDYKMSKKDKRPHGYGFLFYVGLVFVAIALVFVYLNSTVYVPMV